MAKQKLSIMKRSKIKKSTIVLTPKQKEVISLLRKDSWYSLFENMITSGAKWSLARGAHLNWGSVNGTVVNGLIKHGLIVAKAKENIALRQYELTALGKTIEL